MKGRLQFGITVRQPNRHNAEPILYAKAPIPDFEILITDYIFQFSWRFYHLLSEPHVNCLKLLLSFLICKPF